MFLKGFGLLAPVALGGMYMTGAFGGSYERTVDRPPAEVMAAVGDLDLTAQPGAPGTDPTRSGGVLPTFVLERGTDTMTWKVMSGALVATSMTAKFEPLDGGTKTRVTTSVTRGEAPDDLVSPAFRSTGITGGLFAVALEGELNELTLPSGGSPEKCQELVEQMQAEGIARMLASSEQVRETGLSAGARTTMQLHGQYMRLRAAGCDPDKMGGEFREATNEMGTSAMSDFDPVSSRTDDSGAHKKKDPVFSSDSEIGQLGR